MPVDLPAPRLARRWLAENTDPIKILSEFLGKTGQFGKMFVKPHRVARGYVGAGSDPGAQNRVGQFALRDSELDQTKAMTHKIAVNVAPGAPDLAADIETHGIALALVERCEEIRRGINEGLRTRAGFHDREKVRLGRARGRNALERLF